MMVGDVVAGRYELEELVGTGGMSSVYRATDTRLERKVALKILHDSYLADADTIERFRREAHAVARLTKHPGIVTVIDRGEGEDGQYIVFEYVDGENLKSLIERGGRLPVRRSLELAIETGRALAFAHHEGLVHRDVKPQNVLLNADGVPKVTDFGIARSLDVDGVTQTGTVLGTSSYIAPEQASGLPVDARTDVYSLGVVLFELLTGKVPFSGESFVAVAMRHVNEAPPSVLELRPEVPLRVANAVDRALEKAPEDRFATMDDLVAELQACLAELGGRPDEDPTAIVPALPLRETAPRSPRRSRRSRRRVWPLLLALLVAAALAAGAALLLRDGDGAGGPGGGGGTPIALAGVAAYDPPPGDGWEHPDKVGEATDGNPDTYWRTERYDAFAQTKDGVGLVLDAGRRVEAKTVVVRTATPGFRALIQAGDSPEGPFTDVSPERAVAASTTFELEPLDARYLVVWITDIPPDSFAEVNEVTARS